MRCVNGKISAPEFISLKSISRMTNVYAPDAAMLTAEADPRDFPRFEGDGSHLPIRTEIKRGITEFAGYIHTVDDVSPRDDTYSGDFNTQSARLSSFATGLHASSKSSSFETTSAKMCDKSPSLAFNGYLQVFPCGLSENFSWLRLPVGRSVS